MTIGHSGGEYMASDAVKKVLAAESQSGKVIAEARKRSDDIISSAEHDAALAIQKRLSDAAAEGRRLKSISESKAATFRDEVDAVCDQQLEDIRKTAENNTEKAADAIIAQHF